MTYIKDETFQGRRGMKKREQRKTIIGLSTENNSQELEVEESARHHRRINCLQQEKKKDVRFNYIPLCACSNIVSILLT